MLIDRISAIWPEWKVIEEIGEGAYGKVYKAVREEFAMKTYSAIKVISIPRNSTEVDSLVSEGLSQNATKEYFQDIVSDFVNEIKLMESLEGTANVVNIKDYKVIEKDNQVGWDIYIRMELLTPFTKYIVQNPMKEKDIIKLGVDICQALEICARKKIIHRDIKPENIFVSEFGDFKIGDFGIAKELEKTVGTLSSKGTYYYMAPEVVKGEKYGNSVDTYSLGLVLYKLLNNNRLPFLDPVSQDIKYRERKEANDRRLLGEKLPLPYSAGKELSDVILKACEYKAENRFDNPTEFKNALLRINSTDKTVILKDISKEVKQENIYTTLFDKEDIKTVLMEDAYATVAVEAEEEIKDELKITVDEDKNEQSKSGKKGVIIAIAALLILVMGVSIFSIVNNVGKNNTMDIDVTDNTSIQENTTQKPSDEVVAGEKGNVYYLCPEQEHSAAWRKLAETYEKKTGVNVYIVTTSSGDYETVLQAELKQDVVPTLFEVNGPVALEKWEDYCHDLSVSDIYQELTSDAYVLEDSNTVFGIGYSIQSYGIITNKTLLDKAGYKVEDIKSFADLKRVAEDITKRSDELGFAAFASTGMDSSSDWRFKTHLANLPIYFEYQEEGINTTNAIKGSYLDNYRAIFDLYINNSTCEGKDLSAKTGDDARNEFLNGEAVFYQNGSWEYGSLTAEGAYTDADLAMIPVYIGVGDEANQGLCTGTENYWCVNKEADEEDIKATLDFINWCVTSEEGTKAMANEMGLVIPFNKAVESANVFVRQDSEYIKSGKKPVTWNFTTIPSEKWKDNLGIALTSYATEATDDNWQKVVEAFVSGWAFEYRMRTVYVYVNIGSLNDDAINLWAWNDSDEEMFDRWPGGKMEKCQEENWYKLKIDKDMDFIKVIGNDDCWMTDDIEISFIGSKNIWIYLLDSDDITVSYDAESGWPQ